MKPSLEISDEVILNMSLDRAWTLVTDPTIVVGCVPGAEIVSIDAAGSILGALVLTLGPSSTRFEGRITPAFDGENKTGRLEGQGNDGRGRTRAAIVMAFELHEAGPGRTQMSLASSITVGGALAGFAMTGGQALARQLLEEFAHNLSRLEAERLAPSGRPETSDSAEQANELSVVGLVWKTLRRAIRRLYRKSKRMTFKPRIYDSKQEGES